MRVDIVPGSVFPNYELSDHAAVRRKLSDLQEGTLWSWCSAGEASVRKTGVRLSYWFSFIERWRCPIAGWSRSAPISLMETNEYRTGVGAHWPFLSDAGRTVQKDLDIAEYTDTEHNPMIPHTIVLEPGLVVFKIYNGYWFLGRPTLEELRQDLRAVSKKCRPDWRISRSPEQKGCMEREAKKTASTLTGKITRRFLANRTEN